jgi:hypothetical protein
MTDWSWRKDTAAPDYWPAIRDHLEDALREAQSILRWSPELIALIERRFREGEKQYEGDWLTRPLRWFDTEAAEEIADLVTYLAMRRVRAEQIPSGK